MTDLNVMWEALKTHQPLADKNGYGVEWAKMCKERTAESAFAVANRPYAARDSRAAHAVYAAADAAHGSRAAYAVYAAVDAASWAATRAAYAVEYASRATEHITQANKENVND